MREHQTLWSLTNVPKLHEFSYAVTDKDRHQLVTDVINAFAEEIVPKEGKYRKGEWCARLHVWG